jgi:hypothetical protein
VEQSPRADALKTPVPLAEVFKKQPTASAATAAAAALRPKLR